MRHLLLGIVSALITVAAACRDPIGPGPVTGATYSLRPLDQVALPVLMSATVNCDYWLYDGHLQVSAAGAAVLTLNTDLDCTRVGSARDTTEFVFSGTVSQSGALVTFSGIPLGQATLESSRGIATGIRTTLTASSLTLGAFVPLYFGRD